MKTVLKILIIGISSLLLNSCEKNDSISKPKSTSINKIMCLGASRVAGDKPNHESFRYELWKDLIENNWTFDFIGTQTDAASYSMFNNRNFDIDHEGRSGYTSSQILNNITNWIAVTGVPDIVLFSSPGGNDGLQNLPYQQTISNIKAIVALLQQANPTITIVIEQLAPARSDKMSVELTNYFNQLLEDVLIIASENTTTSSQVIAVDMFTNFTDNLLADDVHYNTAGANFIANRYYTLLKTILEK